MISHDLKSPMNAIMGACQLIKYDLIQNHPEVFLQYEQYATGESKRIFSTRGLGFFNANYFTRQHGVKVQLIEPATDMGAAFKIEPPYEVAE